MIKPNEFFNSLKKNDVNFFTGVPDSLLKDFCAYISDNVDPKEHIIAANEGASVSLATGYHLATGKIALVYMQNSGIGNAINPLLSLTDKEVYGIPMLLLIGWRGEPGVKDEPQHIKQGRVLLDMLKSMEIPYAILDKNNIDSENMLKKMIQAAVNKKTPVAIVIKSGTFEKYTLKQEYSENFELTREEAIEEILKQVSDSDMIVSTTGKTSRELFELREKNTQGHQNDFLTVGSMGHSSQIALGLALNTKHKVICIDGDGALLMHLGSLAIIGTSSVKNFLHIVINNGSHESVGGQPTVGFSINIKGIAKSCGYKESITVENRNQIKDAFAFLNKLQGPTLMEIKVIKKSRANLGRPNTTPIENKIAFMKKLQE